MPCQMSRNRGRIKATRDKAMRQDGGGQAMLAQRRAQRRADEEAMAEAVRTLMRGTTSRPHRPPSASDRLSNVVEETITQARACSDFLVSSPFSFCAI